VLTPILSFRLISPMHYLSCTVPGTFRFSSSPRHYPPLPILRLVTNRKICSDFPPFKSFLDVFYRFGLERSPLHRSWPVNRVLSVWVFLFVVLVLFFFGVMTPFRLTSTIASHSLRFFPFDSLPPLCGSLFFSLFALPSRFSPATCSPFRRFLHPESYLIPSFI